MINSLPGKVEEELGREEVNVVEDDVSNEVEEYMEEDSSHRQSSVVVTLTKIL